MWWFKKKKKNHEEYKYEDEEESTKEKIKYNWYFNNEIISDSKEKKKKLKIHILIDLKGGETRSFVQTHELGYSGIQAYYPFYKWFFLRESPYFSFRHSKGCEIFIRDQIKHIKIQKEEVEI